MFWIVFGTCLGLLGLYWEHLFGKLSVQTLVLGHRLEHVWDTFGTCFGVFVNTFWEFHKFPGMCCMGMFSNKMDYGTWIGTCLGHEYELPKMHFGKRFGNDWESFLGMFPIFIGCGRHLWAMIWEILIIL
jgi:hypothetical protein